MQHEAEFVSHKCLNCWRRGIFLYQHSQCRTPSILSILSQVGYEGVQVPFSDEVHETCKAKQWESWVLMHFPCSGDVLSKSGHMARLLDAVTHDYAEAHISDTKG